MSPMAVPVKSNMVNLRQRRGDTEVYEICAHTISPTNQNQTKSK